MTRGRVGSLAGTIPVPLHAGHACSIGRLIGFMSLPSMTLGSPLVSPVISGTGLVGNPCVIGVPAGVGAAVGFPSWTGDEPISRHPSGVPILDGLAAHGAFKAADLARLRDVLAAVINRAASTGSMTRFGHLRKMRFGLIAFQ